MSLFLRKPDRHSSDLIIPGKTTDDDGFILTDVHELDMPTGIKQAVLSIGGLRRLAQLHPQIGLAPAGALAAAEDRVAELEAEISRLQEVVTAHEEREARITGLAADGFTVTRKTGPLPKQKVAA